MALRFRTDPLSFNLPNDLVQKLYSSDPPFTLYIFGFSVLFTVDKVRSFRALKPKVKPVSFRSFQRSFYRFLNVCTSAERENAQADFKACRGRGPYAKPGEYSPDGKFLRYFADEAAEARHAAEMVSGVAGGASTTRQSDGADASSSADGSRERPSRDDTARENRQGLGGSGLAARQPDNFRGTSFGDGENKFGGDSSQRSQSASTRGPPPASSSQAMGRSQSAHHGRSFSDAAGFEQTHGGDVRMRTDPRQMIVAMSRHTESLIYVTVELTPATTDLTYTTLGRVALIENIATAYVSADWQLSVEFSQPPGLTVDSPLEIIQDVLDQQWPGNSIIENKYDGTMAEHTPFHISVEANAKLTLSKFHSVLKPAVGLRPKLRTSCAPARQPTARGALLSLAKRNFGVDFLASPLGYKEFAKRAVEKMMDVLCVDDWRDRLNEMEPIRPSKDNLDEWLATQDPAVVRNLEREDWSFGYDHVLEAVDFYQLILKSMPKVAQDTKPQTTMPTVQTIMFHSKTINSYFGPVFRQVDKRFRSLLRPEVLINKGKNLDVIEKFLTRCYQNHMGCLNVENDFSDYDRSQGMLALCVDMEVMEMMKASTEVVEDWVRGHLKTTNVSYQLGLTVYLWLQRKSGDVNTSDGNTRFNYVSLVYSLELTRSEVLVAIFVEETSIGLR
ncbi:hypothetical protein E4U43_008237 [Claviceps pusilla]|uniref:RdRp catalytic domain-containing protein n=1 Tax=Claviceps pusilla TaxID=123648 RepID=A0A9P7NB11_9HYPO|nr:hypothetical protein E4U43_008237 [Claviceps pusilla]